MMITNITEWNKKKYKVYVDYEFAFVLYKGELHKYKLQVGQIISPEVYCEIKEKVLLKRAKLRAMNLLTKRPYTEKKLRQKLREGLYPAECIEEAMAYVKSFGYIDDAAYARDYITYHMESQSRRQMEQKLLNKGIDAGIIQDCLEKFCGDTASETEISQVCSILQKKYKGKIPKDSTEKAKMMSFFLRKGYTQKIVKAAVAEMDGKLDLDDLYNFD